MTSDPLEAARARMAEAYSVWVYCDDHSHAPRRESIEKFLATPSGDWHALAAKKRIGRGGNVGPGQTMIHDAVAAPGWANDPDVSNGDTRIHYELQCRRTPQCARRVVPARQENLFAVLDGERLLGVSELPLAVLAAKLDEHARRKLG